MKFFRENARFILPLPYLFLAALKGWDGMHRGDKVQFLAAAVFLGVAFLFYLGQKHIYRQHREKTAG